MTTCGGGPREIAEWMKCDIEIILRMVQAINESRGGKDTPQGRPTDDDAAIIKFLEDVKDGKRERPPAKGPLNVGSGMSDLEAIANIERMRARGSKP